MPLYRVQNGDKERLVEANNMAAARNFVARSVLSIEVAKPTDLFRLAKTGIEVESVTGGGEAEAEAEDAEAEAVPAKPAKAA
jgi:hypothetical protein